jgi:hypothetical protein
MPRFACSFGGQCEITPYGPYTTEEECRAECWGRSARDLSYLIYEYTPEELLYLAPSDQREILHRIYREDPEVADVALQVIQRYGEVPLGYQAHWIVVVRDWLGPLVRGSQAEQIGRILEERQAWVSNLMSFPDLAPWLRRVRCRAPMFLVTRDMAPGPGTSEEMTRIALEELDVKLVYGDMVRFSALVTSEIDEGDIDQGVMFWNGEMLLYPNGPEEMPLDIVLNRVPCALYWNEALWGIQTFWLDTTSLVREHAIIEMSYCHLSDMEGPYPIYSIREGSRVYRIHVLDTGTLERDWATGLLPVAVSNVPMGGDVDPWALFYGGDKEGYFL